MRLFFYLFLKKFRKTIISLVVVLPFFLFIFLHYQGELVRGISNINAQVKQNKEDKMLLQIQPQKVQGFLEVGNTITPEEIINKPIETLKLTPVDIKKPVNFSMNNNLWLKITLSNQMIKGKSYILSLGLIKFDQVDFYQRRYDGSINHQISGNNIDVVRWTYPSGSPNFRLGYDDAQEVYLKIKWQGKYVIKPVVMPASTQFYQRVLGLLLLGVSLGALLALMLVSLGRFLEFRYRVDLIAGIYALLCCLTLLDLTSMTRYMPWGNSFTLRYLSGVVYPLTVGVFLILQGYLHALSHRILLLNRLMQWCAYACFLSPLLFFVAPTPFEGMHLILIPMMVALVMGNVANMVAWYKGSIMGRALCFVQLPQLLCGLWIAKIGFEGSVLSWSHAVWTGVTVAITAPFLMYLLYRATHVRKELELRTRHSPSEDMLTGMMNKKAFLLQLDIALQKATRAPSTQTLVVVDLANYAMIQEEMGLVSSEQCVISAAIKVQRLLKDVEPCARIGTARFAFIVGYAGALQSINPQLVKLIASGLTPSPWQKKPIPLQFRCVYGVLSEQKLERKISAKTMLVALEHHLEEEAQSGNPAPISQFKDFNAVLDANLESSWYSSNL